MRNNRNYKLLAGVIGLVLVFAASCGIDKATEPWKDGPRSGIVNDSESDIIEMPDGFSNLATKCDHGNRIYVAYKGDANRAAIAVVPDGCK
jgi:hypothetical protein